MANFGIDGIVNAAKNLFGGDHDEEKVADTVTNATDTAQSAGGGLLDMASSLMKSMTPEDKGFFGVAQDVLKKLDIPMTDVFEILKDGKIDMSDILTIGKIITKIKG